MKKLLFIMGITLLFSWNSAATAAFISGSTGADGAFNPLVSIEVVLPPDGILNYTTVDIPTGVTVTFKKNAANTPVYMLATGDVTIAGTINSGGANGTAASPGKGGSGGFDGGSGGAAGVAGSKGGGPGGGNSGISTYADTGGGGGFGTVGAVGGYGGLPLGGGIYGNDRLYPLIGGSGGGGGPGNYQTNAGGGGGAIVIASSGNISIIGSVLANGGAGFYPGGGVGGGGGSGGAIKLIANQISGNGNVTALGGAGYSSYGIGGKGRIRLEAFTISRTAGTDPPYSLGTPSSIVLPNPPTLSINLVAGTAVPANATGSYNQPDIMLPSSTTNPVAVEVGATNIPVGTVVKIWILPRYGNGTSFNATLSGSDQASTATGSVNLSTVYANVITAEATFTVQQAMNWNGEAIEKVRATASLGNSTKIVYITSSGKEIDAGSLLVAR